MPLISMDVLHVNHHGIDSSTKYWMDLSEPAVVLIFTGACQSSTWHLPPKDIVEKVLLASATGCVEADPALVLQTQEGSPTRTNTSFSGYCVGDILLTTSGIGTFSVSGNGQVNQGPSDVAATGLPRTFALDDGPPPPARAGPWINEFHYDNADADTNELVETAGKAGYEPDGRRTIPNTRTTELWSGSIRSTTRSTLSSSPNRGST